MYSSITRTHLHKYLEQIILFNFIALLKIISAIPQKSTYACNACSITDVLSHTGFLRHNIWIYRGRPVHRHLLKWENKKKSVIQNYLNHCWFIPRLSRGWLIKQDFVLFITLFHYMSYNQNSEKPCWFTTWYFSPNAKLTLSC